MTVRVDHQPTHRWFKNLAGVETCETCAELTAGWRPCKFFTCVTLVAPDDGRYCPAHKLTEKPTVQCKNCIGEGVVDCEESDCHGEYCEDGQVDCDVCNGSGEVEEPVAV